MVDRTLFQMDETASALGKAVQLQASSGVEPNVYGIDWVSSDAKGQTHNEHFEITVGYSCDCVCAIGEVVEIIYGRSGTKTDEEIKRKTT